MATNWTAEQQILIDRGADGLPLLKRVAVSADAGAGKTATLVARVVNLPGDARVLCVSFTERSKADLEARLSERIKAEVYTIHGFCGRVVSEFGAAIGLAPTMRILDQDERDELFFDAFEKVYRRAPPASLEHGMETFLRLCLKAAEVGQDARVRVCGEESVSTQQFVAAVLEEFEQAKRRAHALEYSDLERYAALLLRDSRVAMRYRERYSHVFVDEFQDTSPIQCEIVRALVGQGAPVFVVGDEKQSIYRFRGADVSVFREFVATLPERRRLSANFRSHAEIIEAVNRVCENAIAGYEPMVARRIEKADAVFSPGERVRRVSCENEADAVEAVLRNVKARGIPWSDVVLLMRKVRGQQEELFSDLVRRGIGVAVTASASARMSEDLGRLFNLWIWACEPWQRLRAARVLVDFGTMDGRQVDSTALAGMLDIGRKSPRSGEMTCEALLDALEKDFGLSECFGATFEQFRFFVLRSQSQGLSPGALSRRIQHSLNDERDVGGLSLLPPPANLSGSVRAMTVHASKGLEFPVVILLGLNGGSPSRGAIVKSGRDVWLAGRDDEGKLDKENGEIAAAFSAEREAEEQESGRLLYVAMTRAKEALYVAVKPSSARRKPSLWSRWLEDGIPETVEATALLPKEPLSEVLRSAPALPRRLSPWAEKPVYQQARRGVTEYVASASPAAADEVVPKTNVEQANAGRPTPPGSSRELGTQVHFLFELEDWQKLRSIESRLPRELKKFWQWKETLEGRLVFPERPLSHPMQRIENEFAFEWRRGDTTLTGRVDRLVVLDDEVWIIDYKVLFAKRSRDQLLEAYAAQLKLYAEGVKKMTKSPRVRAFILDVTASTGSIWHEV